MVGDTIPLPKLYLTVRVLVTSVSESSRIGGMETNELEEEEFGFSRNYFLAKEVGTSGKKSAHKLSDIDLIDEQVIPLFLGIISHALLICMHVCMLEYT